MSTSDNSSSEEEDDDAIPSFGLAVNVSCSSYHTSIVLKKNCKIVTFGSASFGRLGRRGPFYNMLRGGGKIQQGTSNSQKVEYTYIPDEVKYYSNSIHCVQIASGSKHTIVIDSYQNNEKMKKIRILTWGSGIHGQLGTSMFFILIKKENGKFDVVRIVLY